MFAASWGTTSSLFIIFLPRPGAALRPAGAPARANHEGGTNHSATPAPGSPPASAPGWSRGIKVSKVGPLFPKSRSRSSAPPIPRRDRDSSCQSWRWWGFSSASARNAATARSHAQRLSVSSGLKV
jgi:hypothetical protein